jgi:hypothetical protein
VVVEVAAGLVLLRVIELELVVGTAVGKTIGFGVLRVGAPLRSFTRDP